MTPVKRKMQEVGKIACIRKLSLFSDLTEDELEQAAQLAEKRIYQKDEPVFWEGEPADQIYIVTDGLVKLAKVSESGREFILGFARADHVLGEDAVFGGEEYSFSAVALQESCVTVCRKDDLEALFRRSPSIAMKVIYSLSRKLNQSTEQLNSLAFHSARERLISALERMAHEYGVRTERGLEIEVPLTHQDIASIINVSRPTATTLLVQLRNEGLLDIVGRRIVLQPDRPLAS